MNYLDKTIRGIPQLVRKVTGHDSGSDITTMTIARPRAQVEAFWREPDNLDQIFDGIAQVRHAGSDRCTWVFAAGANDEFRWETEVVTFDGGLTFVDRDEPVGDWRLRLSFADAPHDLGTEVAVRTRAPLPQPLTGAAVFTALYRARALLQTGEAPTLAHTASGRARHGNEED